MKAAIDIAKGLQTLPSTPDLTVISTIQQLDEGSARVVNALFKELCSIFPAWKQAWPNDAALKAAKATWIKAFAKAGINSLDQIRYGIEACRDLGQDFAPSVGKFIKMCQPTPEMLGLPTPEKAYTEACNNAHPSADRKWTHAAVMHAAKETGYHNLNTLKEEESRKLFDRNYDIACRMVAKGEPLKEIPKALPSEVSIPAKPETVRSELAKMRAMLKGGRA
jgi:hypothetical protein